MPLPGARAGGLRGRPGGTLTGAARRRLAGGPRDALGPKGVPRLRGRREEEGWRRVSLTVGVGLGIEALPAAPVIAQQGHVLSPPLKVGSKPREEQEGTRTTPLSQPPV